ncbi:phosphatidylinositol mannoside acyltransferase [Demequina globuliformis]|uniref:phosphatidylinositol mannoside acyltransferase n=1 Tax=Demequina globuliformis TaxID=676202 RepID=UPI0007844C3F|nr:phosphatidylinositol mannoside acyltransferase [Demequina globuliformis]
MNGFLTAWRVSRALPVRAVRVVAEAGATVVWRRGGRVVERFESNLARVTGRSGEDLRSLSRDGLRSVARYYAEALTLGRLRGEQIDARVRLEGYDAVEDLLATTDRGVVAALSHSGNWDLVGAYAARHIIPVTAVAEVLKPAEVFESFVQMRENVGIHVLGHEGSSTFRRLISLGRRERALICLLADRDLSGTGVEVDMWGERVKVAPGPAALAIALRTPLLPIHVRYERLTGQRRRAAGSPWGVVLDFCAPLNPDDFDDSGKVDAMSQAWAGALAERIAKHPEDWHMLQRFGWVS